MDNSAGWMERLWMNSPGTLLPHIKNQTMSVPEKNLASIYMLKMPNCSIRAAQGLLAPCVRFLRRFSPAFRYSMSHSRLNVFFSFFGKNIFQFEFTSFENIDEVTYFPFVFIFTSLKFT
jgi:hypothetical protein